MKNEMKMIAAVAAMVAVFGGEASASSAARLQDSAAAIAAAAEAGDSARANALLSGLFAGGVRSEAAEPVALAAYQPAAAAKAAVQPKPAARPLRSAVKALPDFEDLKAAPEASEPEAVKGEKEDKPDLAAIQAAAVAQAEAEMAADAAKQGAKEGAKEEGKKEEKKDSALGSFLAGSLGVLAVVGLLTGSYFLLFPLLLAAL